MLPKPTTSASLLDIFVLICYETDRPVSSLALANGIAGIIYLFICCFNLDKHNLTVKANAMDPCWLPCPLCIFDGT